MKNDYRRKRIESVYTVPDRVEVFAVTYHKSDLKKERETPTKLKNSYDCQVNECLFENFPGVDMYINDFGIYSNSKEEHKKTIREVLKRLEKRIFCSWNIFEKKVRG